MVREKGLRLALTALLAATAVSLSVVSSAAADFHLVKVKEIGGSPTGSELSFVELQMYAPGQVSLAGHRLTFWDNDGLFQGNPQPIGSVTLSGADVQNGGNQRTILIGDAGVTNRDYEAQLGDFLEPPDDVVTGGAVCFEAIPIDCVSWGASFDGQEEIPDHAAPHFQALPTDPSFSLRRRIDRRGCPTFLEAIDDTNGPGDFVEASRQPTPNSATPTERPCPPPVRCGGATATRIGTPGPDVLRGTGRRDVIVGLAGRDTIRGLAGRDILCGNRGRDRLFGGRGRDRLIAGGGRDRCVGGPRNDFAVGCEIKRTL